MNALPFSISERAAARLSRMTGRNENVRVLRVAVQSGGCNGFRYTFELDCAPADEDFVAVRGGARVIVDPVSLELLGGAELDYTEGLMRSHFTVHNPNATAVCGCGMSFAVD